jgi:hypothetical protein
VLRTFAALNSEGGGKTTLLANLGGLLADMGARTLLVAAVIPNAIAYKDAFTARTPVHQVNRTGGSRYPSAYDVMHRLASKLQPELYGTCTGTAPAE